MWPAKRTTPAPAERTTVPAGSRRSTPRCPGSQSSRGGAKPCATEPGPPGTGQRQPTRPGANPGADSGVDPGVDPGTTADAAAGTAHTSETMARRIVVTVRRQVG